jgi:hypothetical protein
VRFVRRSLAGASDPSISSVKGTPERSRPHACRLSVAAGSMRVWARLLGHGPSLVSVGSVGLDAGNGNFLFQTSPIITYQNYGIQSRLP